MNAREIAWLTPDGGCVPASSIDLASSPQMRAVEADDVHVDALVTAMENGDEPPPVWLVRIEGVGPSSYVIVDGVHRVLAERKRGSRTVRARFVRGDLALAQWLACRANGTHGLARTDADKRKAVAAALAHPNGREMSDRQLAEHCRVSHPFVAKVRAETEPAAGNVSSRVSKPAESQERRKGRDGKSYPAPTSKVLPRRDPDAYAEADAMRAEALTGDPGAGREMPVHRGAEPPVWRDERWLTLPASLTASWSTARAHATGIVDALEQAKRGVTLSKGAATRGTYDLGSDAQQLDGLGKSIDVALVGARDLVPFAVCPRCGGAKCTVCRGRGWLSKHVLEQLEGREVAE